MDHTISPIVSIIEARLARYLAEPETADTTIEHADEMGIRCTELRQLLDEIYAGQPHIQRVLPCIAEAGGDEFYNLHDFAQYEIQDWEIALRIARELLESGTYEFVGDGVDESTDRTFTLTAPYALRAQLAVHSNESE